MELAKLVVRLTGESSSFKNTMERASAQAKILAGDTRNAGRAAGNMSTAFGDAGRDISGHFSNTSSSVAGFARSMIGALTPLLGITASIATAFKSVKLAAEEEDNVIGFEVMLKSGEKAKALVKDLQKLAADTPMSSDTLQKSAQTLLTYNVAADQLIPTMKAIGDMTGGNSEKFLNMSRAFGLMKESGKFNGDALGSFISAGFNPLQEMAKHNVKKRGGGEDEVLQQMELQNLKKQMEAGGGTDVGLDKVMESIKRATSEGGQFFGFMQKKSQGLKGLFSTMGDDIDAVLRPIGNAIVDAFGLKELMKSVSEIAQMFTVWFKGLDDGTKSLIGSVAGAVIGVGLLTMAGYGLFTVITMISGGLNLYALAFGVIFAGAGVGVAGIIEGFGGVAKTMERVKGVAIAAWDWLKPTRDALESLFSMISYNAVQAWEGLVAYVTSVWDDIAGGSTTTWKDIQSGMQDCVLAIEFGLTNSRQVADFAWTAMKLGALVLWENIVYYATVVLPSAIIYLIDNWESLFSGFFLWGSDGIATMVENIFRTIYGENWGEAWFKMEESFGVMVENLAKHFMTFVTAIPMLLAGGVGSLGLVIGVGLKTEMDKVRPELEKIPKMVNKYGIKSFVAPERKVGASEEELRREFEAKKGALKMSFEAFKKMKLDQFKEDEEWELTAEKEKEENLKTPAALPKQDKADHKDAVEARGAEAKARVAEYNDMLTARQRSMDKAKGQAGFSSSNSLGAEAAEKKNDAVPILKDIRDQGKLQAAKAGTVVSVKEGK